MDGDPLTYAYVSGGVSDTRTEHGVLSGTAPNLIYTPDEDYEGPDSFTFKVNDGRLDSQLATVSILVVNLPPVISITSSSLAYGATTSYTVSGGTGSYSVYTDSGSISNTSGSGIYTANGGNTSDTIYVEDNNTGNSASVGISIPIPTLSITVANNALKNGETTSYTVVGGSGSYSINANNGTVSSSSGSGIYTASGGQTSDTIYVEDNNIGNSASVGIAISLPPSERRLHSAVEIAGKMYIFGGEGASGNDVWVFDPANDRWAQLSPSGTLPAARRAHSAVVIANKMYVFGGTNHSGDMNDTWVFDPASGGSWAQLNPSGTLPSVRYGQTAVAISDKLYLFGGYSSGNLKNDTWVFDPASGGSWAQLNPSGTLPSVRMFHSAVAISGKMYVFGSSSDNSPWVFDPSSGGSWARLNPTGTPPGARGHTAVAIAGKMYVFGGSGNNFAWVLDPSSGGSWAQLNPTGSAPSARTYHSAVSISDKMYVFGGQGEENTNDTWIFDPTSNGSWTSIYPYTTPLSISVAKSLLQFGETITYTVVGGSGSYTVYSSQAPVSNGSGSGTYTANVYNTANDSIFVRNNITGETVSASISIKAPVLTMSSTTMSAGSTVSFNITDGSGNYTILTNYGSTTLSGSSGTYTADGGVGSDLIEVIDNNTDIYTGVNLIITP